MEVGVQTDTLTNKNIVVLKEKQTKKGTKPRVKKNIRSITGATPDINQQWRIWKGIDERNLLRNVEIEEDIVDKLTNVFGVKQTDVEKAMETFQKGRGKGIIGFQEYTKEQEDNRRVAGIIRGDRVSAFQNGLEGRRAYTGWEGANWDLLERASMRSGRPLEEVFPFSSINWGDAPAPRFTMSEIENSQRRPLLTRELRQLDTRNILDERLRPISERRRFGDININSALGTLLQRAGIRGNPAGVSSNVASQASTRVSSNVASGRQTPYSRYGISGGLRTGDRRRKVL